MNFSEYRQKDALDLAKLIQKKEITAQELLEIATKRIEEVNPKINAIVHKMPDLAKEMASQISDKQPFAGVPFLIKDLAIDIKGQPLTDGSRAYQKRISEVDSEFVKRLRAAGFLFLGKTNIPEFGLNPFSEPELHGACRNPWDTNHSPGGSSGGSGASVAAGIVPIATASDGGGSIRIPAAFNGLFGLKPSRGRISLAPFAGQSWGGAVVEGCVSRSVRDSAAYLDAIAGGIQGDPFIIAPPSKPYLELIQEVPKKLKVGFSTEHVLGHEVSNDAKDAIKKTIGLLEDLGHEVEEVKQPYQKEDLTEVFTTILVGQVAADIAKVESYLGRKINKQDVELNTWLLAALGRVYTAEEYVIARRKWNDITRKVAQFHENYDIWLTPTVATPPFQIGELKNTPKEDRQIKNIRRFKFLLKLARKQGLVELLADKAFSKIPFTPIANMTGNPSMSVPLHWSEKGLPIGVMFSGKFGAEDTLLQLAKQLEDAQPWFNKVPEL